ARSRRTVGGPGGRAAAAEPRPVDQVVVDERRHVDQLDGDSGCERRGRIRVRGEEDQHRPQPLAAGRQRVRPDRSDDAGMARDGALEALLELVEVALEPGRLADRGENRHPATPVWRATIPPAKVRYETSTKPARPSSAASS